MINYILIDENNLDKHEEQLLRFEQQIFINAFPNSDERESFTEDIIPRIKGCNKTQPKSFCVLAAEDDSIVGGLVADWYPDCNALEIIYITVDSSTRKKGIGKGLLDNGIKLIQSALLAAPHPKKIEAIFLEVDIPSFTMDAPSSMDPIDRLKFWNYMGAKRIPINYVQPPLGKGKQPVSNLMLMCLTGYGTGITDKIQTSIVKKFLKDFYNGLNAGKSEYLNQMYDDLEAISVGHKIEIIPLLESPSATITNSVVTTHYSVPRKIKIQLPETCNSFNSYECDLMNYTSQKNRPIRTKLVTYLENVTIIMPSYYRYTSEGVTHYRLSLNEQLKADISISISSVANKKRAPIAHITIIPSKEQQSYNNLDYTKFITNFGSKQEEYEASAPIKVAYKANGQDKTENITFEELLGKILKTRTSKRIKLIGEGATEFNILNIKPCKEENSKKSDFDISGFFTTRFTPGGRIRKSLINKIICGLILGIFDYKRMEPDEIEDTIRPIVKTDTSFFVTCRGHIFKIEANKKSIRSVFPKILISPYHLVPSATLAFNGLILDKCEKLVKRGLTFRFLPLLTGLVQKAEILLNLHYIEDIFQYQSEIEITQEAQRQRCMKLRYAKLNSQFEIIKKRTGKSSDIFMEGILAIIAIFGAFGVLSSPEFTWNNGHTITVAILGAFELLRWLKARNIRNL